MIIFSDLVRFQISKATTLGHILHNLQMGGVDIPIGKIWNFGVIVLIVISVLHRLLRK